MKSYRDYVAAPDRACAVVAHRGAWHSAPENSISAIEAAIEQGFEIVEVDVRRSADGTLFLFHDDTLDRMTGNAGPPEALSIAELTRMPLFNRDGGTQSLTHEAIPTLTEAFAFTSDRIYVDLDLKDPGLIGEVIACAKAAGVAGQIDVKAKVASVLDIERLRKDGWLDDVPFMAQARLSRDTIDDVLPHVVASRPIMCEAKFDALSTIDANQERFADAGIGIWVNTLDGVSCCGLTDTAALVDPQAVWGRLIDAGVSAIQTDEPVALRDFVAARGDSRAKVRS